jgi:glycine/D-amino acid oxidase-like deaminating enzyme
MASAGGRHGGQIIPGLKYDPDELVEHFGPERGQRIADLAGRTGQIVFDLVERHGLDCGARSTAWVQAIDTPAKAERAKRRAEQWQQRGAPVDYVDAGEAARLSGTQRYVGAFVDRRAGAIQPLSYARELARVAAGFGARLRGASRIDALERRGELWHARLERNRAIEAEAVLVCTNAYSGALVPDLSASIIAANSLQLATEPLPDALAATILPGGEVLSDTRRIIRYWRMVDNRLVIGGRGPYREAGPEGDWAHLVRDVETLFPRLKGIAFTHRWGGRVAVHPDYLPRLHAPAPGLFAAIGCQGRGIGWQTAMGAELARLVLEPGYDAALPVSRVTPIPFAGLRAVGVSATIAWYRALDRLGVA